MTIFYSFIIIFIVVLSTTTLYTTQAFSTTSSLLSRSGNTYSLYQFQSSSSSSSSKSKLYMAQISQDEAMKYINKVKTTLQKDKQALSELGKLTKVNNILGYGAPSPDIVAVRFNASFSKSGKGLSSVPLPFGLGQSNVSEGRGVMVGQVKANVDRKSGRVVECSVFRDLGYGRAFNLKC